MSNEELTLEVLSECKKKLQEADVKAPYFGCLPNALRTKVDDAIATGVDWEVIQEHENHFIVAFHSL